MARYQGAQISNVVAKLRSQAFVTRRVFSRGCLAEKLPPAQAPSPGLSPLTASVRRARNETTQFLLLVMQDYSSIIVLQTRLVSLITERVSGV